MPNQFYTEADAGPNGALTKNHLEWNEVRCHAPNDPSNPCPYCGGEGMILVETAWGYGAVRNALGEPIQVISGHRCIKHQQVLWEAEVAKHLAEGHDHATAEKLAAEHVARPSEDAPHLKAALDLARPSSFDTSDDFADFIDKTLNGDVRIGVYSWGCHMDRCHKLDPNPDPTHYHKGARW